MSHDVERLRAAPSDRYTIERELGRGMATVYPRSFFRCTTRAKPADFCFT
jgi:hypothetical protein